MCSRVDFTTDSEPIDLPSGCDEFFQGAVHHELHAWVPQAALGSGVLDNGKVISDHPSRSGDRRVLEEERDSKTQTV
eukprot:6985050-Heterocapsa_arctica.AAC.1